MGTRLLHSEVFEVPEPRMVGEFAMEVRLRIIADGIRDCIEHCPKNMYGVVTSLGYAWMGVEGERRRLAKAAVEQQQVLQWDAVS